MKHVKLQDTSASNDWDFDISRGGQSLVSSFKEVLRYRDLLWLFTRRDLVSVYKQTLLGPLWIIIQPLATTMAYAVVFGGIAGLPTDEVPDFLFYLLGVTFWGLFATTFTTTANIFVANEDIFSKVYFPRLVSILSALLSQSIIFAIQFLIFSVLAIALYGGLLAERLNQGVYLVPLIMAIVVLAALGLGLLVAASTVRYRDLRKTITFGIQILLYATPVIYPLSEVPESILNWLRWNPLATPFEALRAAFFGTAGVTSGALLYSLSVVLAMAVWGVLAFHKVERNFVDEI